MCFFLFCAVFLILFSTNLLVRFGEIGKDFVENYYDWENRNGIKYLTCVNVDGFSCAFFSLELSFYFAFSFVYLLVCLLVVVFFCWFTTFKKFSIAYVENFALYTHTQGSHTRWISQCHQHFIMHFFLYLFSQWDIQ